MRKKLLVFVMLITILSLSLAYAEPSATVGTPISKIIINYSYITKNIGDSFTVNYSVEPETADRNAIIWLSSNKSVASVNSNGVVTCKSAGSSTIQAVSTNSIVLSSFNLKVTEATPNEDDDQTNPDDQSTTPDPTEEQVVPKNVESVALNYTQIELVEGNSQYLIATIFPPTAANKNVKWRSSDLGVVTVNSNGLIQAVSPGEATIELTTQDGNKKTRCTVRVVPILVESNVNATKPPKADEKLTFEDVTEDHFNYQDIKYVFDNDLMKGVSDKAFEPQTAVNRAMMATVIYRMQDEPRVFVSQVFSDVTPSKWYAKAVVWINFIEVMNGFGDGKFNPEAKLTREQLATILYRYAQYRKKDVTVFEDLVYLEDHDEIGSWAYPAVKWAHRLNMLDVQKGFVRPRDPATRADVARALHLFVELVLNQSQNIEND